MPISTINPASISGLGYGFKNRIINGDMRIDQRNGGAVSSGYSVDRWACFNNITAKATLQKSTVAPAGFVASLLVTSTSAYTVAAGEVAGATQAIEGFNIADLAWGTAAASSATLSFWVRSSLTGQFGGAVRNSNGTQSYPFAFTVNAANTFEYKTVLISGPTAGTWATDNTAGIVLVFSAGAGSSLKGTAGVWSTASLADATGSNSLVGTSGATFYITGVQLEAGVKATNFDYRPYGIELALCQRYCEVIRRTAVGSEADTFAVGVWSGATNVDAVYKYYVQKRAVPTVSFSGTSGFEFLRSALAWEPVTSWNTPEVSVNTVRFNALVATGDTRGFTTELRVQGTNTITISAEL